MPLRLAEVTGVLLTLGIAAPEKRTPHHLSTSASLVVVIISYLPQMIGCFTLPPVPARSVPWMLLRAYRTQVTFGLVLLCRKMHPATYMRARKRPIS